MKFVCIRSCFIRNTQGRFQRFSRGDVVETDADTGFSEHFVETGDSGQKKKNLHNKNLRRS